MAIIALGDAMAGKGLVLVTGASGFVGKWTVIELLRAGHSVRGTVRSAAKAEAVRRAAARALGGDDRLQFCTCDLMDDAGWADAMVGVDAVMHVAAQILAIEPRDPNVVIGPAVGGTRRVLRFAAEAGIKRVILTSSIATVGYGQGHTSGKRIYTEEHFTKLEGMKFTWAYCIGKTRAEQVAWAFAKEKGLELTTIHPGAILGPAVDDDASISLGMVSGLLEGTTPAMPSNGFPSSMCATWRQCMWLRWSDRIRRDSATSPPRIMSRFPKSPISCARRIQSGWSRPSPCQTGSSSCSPALVGRPGRSSTTSATRSTLTAARARCCSAGPSFRARRPFWRARKV
ncbi:NAD-dependent epimerase/dehydratase family protein [Devosia sp.]|uniref:NAD-dependent epimerase/dehydratase family protein n=1 Tax=Devosia sp. TaxID=1871048 RepID=UPI002606AF82|nr:NAD-dependent epimerase/dehydratase family protein [Devosia sp.]